MTYLVMRYADATLSVAYRTRQLGWALTTARNQHHADRRAPGRVPGLYWIVAAGTVAHRADLPAAVVGSR